MSEPVPDPERADGVLFTALMSGLVTASLAFLTIMSSVNLAHDGLVDQSMIGTIIALGTLTFVAGLVCATSTIVYAIRTLTAPREPDPAAQPQRAVDS